MLLSVERPNRGSLCLSMTRGHAAALDWSGASSPAGVGLEHGKRTIEVPQELGRSCCFLGNIPAETPGYQLQALAAHSSARERTQRVNVEVSPSEGNEVRRDGQQEVIAS